MTEHISTYTAPMFNTCPYCKAKPFEPCYNMHSLIHEPVRYTHHERSH